eukprot:5294925-Prymnesium_polylepis.1
MALRRWRRRRRHRLVRRSTRHGDAHASHECSCCLMSARAVRMLSVWVRGLPWQNLAPLAVDPSMRLAAVLAASTCVAVQGWGERSPG